MWIKNEDDKIMDKDYEEFVAMKMMLMTAMSEMGITPEEYSDFLRSDIDKEEIKDIMLKNPRAKAPMDDYKEDCRHLMRRGLVEEMLAPIPDADNKSLKLKVQMKDVTKPPMWREIIIPADFNFTQLHYAIQACTGLDNSHLWQFQHRAYDPELQIGIPLDDDEFGLDEWTHNADETPVTGFLAKKGDKLEYVYDFGDDWVFTVSVIDVMERKDEVAICTKWKSDLQPIEDCGGVYAYIELREIEGSITKLSAKEKKEVASRFGFDDFNMFAEWLDEANIDIEFVNEQLAEIPDKWEGAF